MQKQLRVQSTERRAQSERTFRIFLFSVLCPLFSESAYACPACKEAVGKLKEIWTSVGFNWSVLFMISIPFLIIGSFAAVLFLNYRKTKQRGFKLQATSRRLES